MPESTISVLRRVRSELEQKIAEVDSAIRTVERYAPETHQNSTTSKKDGILTDVESHMTAGDAALDALNNASGPLTTLQVAEAITERGTASVTANAINTALNRLEKKGAVQSVPDIKPKTWRLPNGQMPSSDHAQNADSVS